MCVFSLHVYECFCLRRLRNFVYSLMKLREKTFFHPNVDIYRFKVMKTNAQFSLPFFTKKYSRVQRHLCSADLRTWKESKLRSYSLGQLMWLLIHGKILLFRYSYDQKCQLKKMFYCENCWSCVYITAVYAGIQVDPNRCQLKK